MYDFKLSPLFIDNNDPYFGCWYRVEVGNVANVSEEHTVSVVMAENVSNTAFPHVEASKRRISVINLHGCSYQEQIVVLR